MWESSRYFSMQNRDARRGVLQHMNPAEREACIRRLANINGADNEAKAKKDGQSQSRDFTSILANI
jgi:hypothetical protein